ncbi:hypothetical protein [Moritella viscosa]|uniref:Uncharacterized protein n=1 Tax=Moritella viscosa TaxID=80854 RepID=A0A090IG98_9GAMM|nr:hypothetical protein [Moritella viscosa]CED61605.1 membrane protein [Moritella viscosa]SGY89886.1 Putative uncharacterized protein [Moritella viscosa]SGY93767.1 Putative uncharacterized protein [Moritella viscosa]SGY98177.1 Putative uncharacterized protein [Moritella viscosa]SGY98550.1 Putative uncharacterized protein [Moritella viscosa]
MQSKFLWIFFIISISFSSLSYAKDFFRVSGGDLLISNNGMTHSEVVEIINNEKSFKRISYNRYILNASVGGEFEVKLTFKGGKLTGIKSKQMGRVDYH